MQYDLNKWSADEDIEERAFSEGPIPIYEATDWLLGGQSASGLCIDRMSILSSAPVVRAIQIITGWIGKLPLEVYKSDKTGSADIDEEHPAQWLLSHHPSDLYTPRDFKKTMAFNFLVHGSAYGWIQRENDVDPSEIIILNPEYTGVTWRGKRLMYYTRINDHDELILPENVLHWKNLSWDGIRPINMLDVLRDAFSVGIAAQSYANHFYKNDSSPKLMLEFPRKVDDAQITSITERWEKKHQGTKNSQRLGILGDGGHLSVPVFDHEASQFLQTREFEIACTISNIFGIPKTWLGIDGSSNGYNGLEQISLSFLNNTLDEILVGIEEECERKLLRESQRVRNSHYIEFDRRSLQRGDSVSEMTKLTTAVNGGIMTENEARAELNLPVASGTDGDRMRMPTNVGFVDSIGAKGSPITDTPNPPAELVAGADDGKDEPMQISDIPDTDERYNRLYEATMKRINTRLQKAYKAAVETRSDLDIEAHASVIMESGLGYDLEQSRAFVKRWVNEQH
jgi:HK97 family phage portal protein